MNVNALVSPRHIKNMKIDKYTNKLIDKLINYNSRQDTQQK